MYLTGLVFIMYIIPYHMDEVKANPPKRENPRLSAGIRDYWIIPPVRYIASG